MDSNSRTIGFVALLGLQAVTALAQETQSEVGDRYFDELPVVLSASRMVQSLDEAPASVTVIDRELIAASGVRRLVDVFRLVPGMVVGQHKGGLATLGFHGFTDPYFRQLQVLIDGVSVYSPVWGGADWYELPISVDDVERIEVVRGPNAATFGANSFLGVVNIITRDPAVERGGEVLVDYGEDGIRDEQVRYSFNSGDLRQRLTVGQQADDGLSSYPDSRRSNYANLRGHYRLSTTDEARWQIGYAGGAQGSGVYATPNHTDGARTAHYDYGSGQLRWTRSRGVDNEVWVQFNYAERDHRERLPFVVKFPAPFGNWDYPLNFNYRYRRADIESQQSFRVNDEVRGVWGGQARSDSASSLTYFHTDDWLSSQLYRVFGNLEWRVTDRWIVSGGVMYEKNSVTGGSWSPSLSANYQVATGHTVRMRIAKARRTPTMYEDRFDWYYESPQGLRDQLAAMPQPYSSYAALPLASTIKTTQDLQDERIRSSELAYIGRFPAMHATLECDVFEHRIDGYIGQYKYPFPTLLGVVDPHQPSKYDMIIGFANQGSAKVSGESMSLRWYPAIGTMVYLTGARTKIKAEGPEADTIEQSAPLWNTSLLVSQDLFANWSMSVAYYHASSFAVRSGGALLPATDRVDIRLADRLAIGGYPIEVALVVQNLDGGIPVFELRDKDVRTVWMSVRVGLR